MSEKKRKRNLESDSEHPRKKVAFQTPPDSIEVHHVPVENEWAPILASTPGLVLSSKTSFKAYTKTRIKNGRSTSELLLHSSPHPRLEYTACEEESGAIENLQKHYIGIYDPANGELQLMEARKVAIRGRACSDIKDLESDEASSSLKPVSNRMALGLAFGTKKSQKAIRSFTENAILSSPTKSHKSSQSSPAKPALDPADSIILDSITASSAFLPSQEEMQSAIDDAKPIPKPNMQAEVPADVYPLEQLVGLGVMKILPVKDWIDKVESGEDIVTKSRFVSHRVRQVVKSEDVRKIKALKYLLLLVEWYLCFKPVRRDTRKLPTKEQLATAMPDVDPELLDGLTRRFAEDRQLNKWQTHNLQTHICALTLTIDNFTTDTHDLCADLHLEQKELSSLFKQLGCRVSLLTDQERARLNLARMDVSLRRIARLVLPLEFPKVRGGAGKGRGKGKGRGRG